MDDRDASYEAVGTSRFTSHAGIALDGAGHRDPSNAGSSSGVPWDVSQSPIRHGLEHRDSRIEAAWGVEKDSFDSSVGCGRLLDLASQFVS